MLPELPSVVPKPTEQEKMCRVRKGRKTLKRKTGPAEPSAAISSGATVPSDTPETLMGDSLSFLEHPYLPQHTVNASETENTSYSCFGK